MRLILAIFRKDLLIEFRTRDSFLSMVIFGVLIVVLFNFAVEISPLVLKKIGGGILWITYLFAAVLGLNHSFSLEKDNQPIHSLMLLSGDRGKIYFGKFLSGFVRMLVVEIVLLPLFFLFLRLEIAGNWWHFIFGIILGTSGLMSVGTLFSGISVNTRMKEVLLPVLLFPVSTPVLIASAKISEAIITGEELASYQSYFGVLVAYNVLFLSVSYLAFDYILEE